MASPVAGARLCGRDAELDAITASLRELVAERHQVVHVAGEAGIGKSALVDVALDQAAGLTALKAKAEEQQRGRPFGALLDALEVAPARCATAVEAFRAALADRMDEFEVIERATAALEAASFAGPTVLVIDDLHWADPSTIRTLHYASRHLDDLPFGVLTAARPAPVAAGAAGAAGWLDYCRQREGLLLELGPLAPSAVDELVASLGGGRPGTRLGDLATKAAGNPFFLVELMAGLAADGALVTSDGMVEVDAEAASTSVVSSIVRFVGTGGPASVELLQVAAVLGVSFAVGDLADLAGQPTASVVAMVREAERAGLLRRTDDGMAFRHDLLREALYGDLSESSRRALHLEIADALAIREAPATVVAEHLLLGGGGRRPGTVTWLRKAALELTDLQARLEVLRRLLEIVPAGDPVRREVAAECVSVIAATGSLEDAQTLVETELALDPAAESGLRAALARSYADRLQVSACLEEIGRVFQVPELPASIRIEMEAFRGSQLLLAGDPDGAAVAASWVLTHPAPPSPPMARVIAHQVLSSAAVCAGDQRRAIEHAHDAVREETPTTPSASHLYLTPALVAEDRFTDAEASLRVGYARLRAMGYGTPQGHYPGFRALLGLVAGRLDDAATDAEACLNVFADLRVTAGSLYSRAVLARVAIHRGQLDAARRWVDPTAPPAPEAGADWWLWAASGILETTGDIAAAYESMKLWWQLFGPLRNYFGGLVVFGPDLVRLAVDVGDRDVAEEATAELGRLAGLSDAPSVQGAHLLCRGRLEADRASLAASVESYAAGPRLLDTARAREALANDLDDDAAGEQWRRALTAYEEAGAAADAARVLERLRRLGLVRGARARTQRPAFGWDALTPSELQVVELALTGLVVRVIAERLSISPHTVETHLRHVYRKVGVSSRIELMVAAKERSDGT